MLACPNRSCFNLRRPLSQQALKTSACLVAPTSPLHLLVSLLLAIPVHPPHLSLQSPLKLDKHRDRQGRSKDSFVPHPAVSDRTRVSAPSTIISGKTILINIPARASAPQQD